MFKHAFILLFVTGVVLLVFSFFVSGRTFIVNLYDTYYVINLVIFYRVLALIIIFLGVLSRITINITISPYLRLAHVILTIAGIVILTAASLSRADSKVINQIVAKSLEQQSKLNRMLSLSIILLAAGQLMYLIDLVGGFVRNVVNNR